MKNHLNLFFYAEESLETSVQGLLDINASSVGSTGKRFTGPFYWSVSPHLLCKICLHLKGDQKFNVFSSSSRFCSSEYREKQQCLIQVCTSLCPPNSMASFKLMFALSAIFVRQVFLALWFVFLTIPKDLQYFSNLLAIDLEEMRLPRQRKI